MYFGNVTIKIVIVIMSIIIVLSTYKELNEITKIRRHK